MKLKTTLLCLAMCALGTIQAIAVDLSFQQTNASMITYDYDASTGVYTFTTTGGDPFVCTNTLTANLADDDEILTFEYQSEQGLAYLQVFYANTAFAFSGTQVGTYAAVPASSDWATYKVNISSARSSFNWGNRGGMLRFDLGQTAGVTIKMRNVKIISSVSPYKQIEVQPGAETLVEAEDYNQGGNGVGYSARQYNMEKLGITPYKNPVDGKMPILAWGSLGEYMQDASYYRELAECGFNLSISRLNEKGKMENALSAANETGVKVLFDYYDFPNVVAGRKDLRNWFIDNENFAGWAMSDEPLAGQFATLGAQADTLRAVNKKSMLYLNLLNCNATGTQLGTKNYADYLQRSLREVHTGFISYDMYPIIEENGKRTMRPRFYQNLELAMMVAKEYGVPFWAFARSRSDANVNGVTFPAPTEAELRFQQFSNLAYGAQGVQYYTYVNSDLTDLHAPLQIDHSDPDPGNWKYVRTDTWTMVQNVNKEIQALSWVFLNSDVSDVRHLGTSTPTGCKRYQANALPKGFNSIAADGSGVLISEFTSPGGSFLMLVSHDFTNSQKVTISRTVGVKQVNRDGTTTDMPVANGDETFTLDAGGYLIFQLAEGNSQVKSNAEGEATTTAEQPYRADEDGVDLQANAEYGNGHGLFGMGDPDWRHYTYGSYASTTGRTITMQQAELNWGSWYKYTFDVAEDMDVNISIKHNVPWDKYAEIAAEGVAPSTTGEYSIQGRARINWPQRYNAAMIMALDGNNLTTAQQSRPVASTYTDGGEAFNQLLADKSKWTSTLKNNAQNDTLWFWPAAGGDNSLAPVYHSTPDYAKVRLTKGTHTLQVKSLCANWNFDCIRIADVNYTGIDDVTANGSGLQAYGVTGAIVIRSDKPASVYTATGALLGTATQGEFPVSAGAYVVRAGNKSVKVLVR